ncbi:MAG TPA: glycoside hydrolase family 31 protein [Anaerolineae bacterium]|nr:glycoside hydrolase family 31 protein [Anaerolineae bacterium]
MPTLINSTLDTIRLIGAETAVHSVVYRFRKAWAESGWNAAGQPRRGLDRLHAFNRELNQPPRPTWPDAWTTPGRVRIVAPTARGATFTTERAVIEIAFFAPDLVRVRVKPHVHAAVPEPIPYAIAKPLDEWPAPAVELIQGDAACFLSTAALTVGVALDTAQVIIADADGRLLRADVDAAWGPQGELRHRTALAPAERLFGLGERATPGNRRGRTHILWNTDPSGYAPGDDPIDLNIPMYVSVQEADRRISGSADRQIANYELRIMNYAVFYENPAYAEFDLGETTFDIASHRFAGGELRYYVMTGSLPTMLERYTELTGRHDLPPLWMLGYQQCRWSYYPESRVRKLAQDFKKHDVPCDAIYLDIDYLDNFRCFTWDKRRFPNLPQLVADLRAQGIKTITMIDPGIKKDPKYFVYRSGLAGDHFCKTPDGHVFHAPVWPGLSAFPDFTDPATRAWWGELYRPLLDIGIAGFWNDMNEPAAFAQPKTSTLPLPLRHNLEGRGGDHAEAHNLYGMQMVRATREGLLMLRPEKRPIVITRAGWAGVQRHAISWTGDNQSTWESLRLTVPEIIGLGLSGLGFTGPDTGGFAGEADGELFTRWIQMAAFLPLFRAHTSKNTADQEPWSYGEPYLSIVRRFIQLRYELLPYLYTAIWQMCQRGWPMVRPLGWDVPEAAALWDVEDAFLCGDALLVAPIGKPGATSRLVTLPPGGWYDFWTNKLHATDSLQSVDAFAPLETMPLFVRAGTVLPMGEFAPSVEQRVQKFLRLGVYPLPAPGEATSELYEDAGEGFTYRDGDYCYSRFHLVQTAERITITWERAGNFAPPYEHIELTLNGLHRAPRQVLADGVAYPVVMTDPVRRTALLGIPPFEKLEITL